MTPNTDNPNKPRPQENEGVATPLYKPPANQGDDELEQILKDLQTSWMYESPKPDFEATALRLREAAKSSIVALHHRQLAERLQMVLDSLAMQDGYGFNNEPLTQDDVKLWLEAQQTLRSNLRELITSLMPKEA